MYFHKSLIPRGAYFLLPLESKQEATSGWNFTKCISEVMVNQLKVKNMHVRMGISSGWSTARSIRSLTRRVEIFFFKRMLSQETAATWYFLGFIGTPPWPLSVKPHTTGLNFSSILTKQCISFNPTHWYLNIPLDQTHPFLKGFYFCLFYWSYGLCTRYHVFFFQFFDVGTQS